MLYEQKRERIFVDKAEKEAMFKELCDMFLNSTLTYLSKDIFPKQYILKKYEEEIKKKLLSHGALNEG